MQRGNSVSVEYGVGGSDGCVHVEKCKIGHVCTTLREHKIQHLQTNPLKALFSAMKKEPEGRGVKLIVGIEEKELEAIYTNGQSPPPTAL